MNVFKKIFYTIYKSKATRLVAKSNYFDKDWYKTEYPEIVKKKIDPVYHYINIGWKDGYNPSALFDTNKYLLAYPDVKKTGINPLLHFLHYGKEEGRYNYYVDSCVKQLDNKLNTEPLISIIVTSFNYEKFISETLDSLLMQSYHHFEVIVIDDGSKDNSIEVIKAYTKKDCRIQLFTHELHANKGLPASIQLALSHAKGEYIAFCESDDCWTETHLEEKVKIINSYPNVNIISNRVAPFGDEVSISQRKRYFDCINAFLSDGGNRIDIKQNIEMNYIPTLSCVMIKKTILEEADFKTPIPAWIDFWLYRQILKRNILYYTSQCLTNWRIHQSYNDVDICQKHAEKAPLFFAESNHLLGIKIHGTKLVNVIKHSTLFDEKYYTAHYGNELGELDAYNHYLYIGWWKGYNPSCLFSTSAYINRYFDIKLSKINPLIHYELYGRAEHRKYSSVKDTQRLQVSPQDIEFARNARLTSRVILLISHELSLTGAPRALLNLAQTVKKRNITPIFICAQQGDMEQELQKEDIHYIVDPLLRMKLINKDSTLMEFLAHLDMILFNTLDSAYFIEGLTDINVKKKIWIHEGQISVDIWQNWVNIGYLLSLFDEVYAVGEYSRTVMLKQVNKNTPIGTLLYGIPDIQSLSAQNSTNSEHVRMIIAGTIGTRKGHDILIESLKHIPKYIQKQLEIIIAGSVIERHVGKALSKCKNKCLNNIGQVDHETLMKLFNEVDVVLCPSIDDPMPIVCTEAMILGKPIIVSESTGTASFIENGVNGFRIKAGDAKALADAITYAVLHKAELPIIGKRSRAIYNENFTMQVFEKNIFEKIIK